MELIEKGCVYFFKHAGLSPIKIGYSRHESPISRFEQFKTYAPFGAELIGFIRTAEAKKFESELHQKFATNRVKGEWFEISKSDAEKCISFYSNLEDIEEFNNFQIAWARSLNEKIEIEKDIEEDFQKFVNVFSDEPMGICEVDVYGRPEIRSLLGIDKKSLILIEEKLNLKYSIFRHNGTTKRGYRLYKKTSNF